MATFVFGPPQSGALTASAADLYTAVATVEEVRQASFCNTGASTRLVTVWRTPSGGSDEMVLNAEPLPPGETLNLVALLGPLHLAIGDKLRAKQDAGADVRWLISPVRMS